MMAVLRLFILLTVLLMHLDHCGGQKDPPQRFEARTRERDKRRAAEKEKRRAERRGEEAPQKQELTPNPNSNSNVQDGQANREPEAPVKKNQASTIDLHKIHANSKAQEIFPWNNQYEKRQREILQELREEMYVDVEDVFIPKGSRHMD